MQHPCDRRRRVVRRIAAVGTPLAILVGTAGCTLPAHGSEDYRASAARTAGEASSEISTATLACRLAVEQRAWQPYLRLVVSDAEDSLSGIENTFAALQPPSAADLRTRHDLIDVLDSGIERVTAVRLALFAGLRPRDDCSQQLQQVQQQLDDAAARLTGQAGG